jgi:ATP-dependent Clp protease ATP-binding subunit ClpC
VGVTVELEDSAKRFLVEKGYDAKFGARPLRRAIQKYVEDPMAEAILGHDLGENDTLIISYDEKKDTGELSFRKKKTASTSKKKAAKASASAQTEADGDEGASAGDSSAAGGSATKGGKHSEANASSAAPGKEDVPAGEDAPAEEDAK